MKYQPNSKRPSAHFLACASLALPARTIVLRLHSAILCLVLVLGLHCPLMSADVQVSLSPIETEVNGRIVLTIAIVGAANYKRPAPPEIDGCEVQFSGQGSQSSTVLGAGGRAQSSQSVMLQYSIVPRRAGAFEVPPITLVVDGQQVTTEPQRFVVGKRELNEAGDLLFVEIAGERERVYVGQPLELSLKIWIKPYEDRAQNIRLSEANMWQLLAKDSSWGSFGDRMKELALSQQRPGGREVLRDNGRGQESSYFLYEINATIYPKRPGLIDSQDVEIIVNYPTGIGRARDPLADFFGNSPFGRDDFFASPFSRQLSINGVRDITTIATSGQIEVLPIPIQGRPADYRGAVGTGYRIVTQASPTKVAAGDPITLNIGITGAGPMELLQAPPLADLVELAKDFKVDDQPLAGFVQDEAKVFSTAIRPRRADIQQIPSIAFSYFDPEAEKFETVRSDPIPISVEESEMLALDTVVGKTTRDKTQSNNPAEAESQQPTPIFSNNHTAEALLSPSVVSDSSWWWAWILGPPLLWLVVLLIRNSREIAVWFSNFKPAHRQCLQAIHRAQQPTYLTTALVRYVGRRTKSVCANPVIAVGLLRTAGFYPLANEFEAFFENCESFQLDASSPESQARLQSKANELVAALEGMLASQGHFRVRGAKSSHALQRMSLILLALQIGAVERYGVADEHNSSTTNSAIESSQTGDAGFKLTTTQQQLILKEAGEVYARAQELKKSDSADANELLSIAAEKYRLLIASGIHNGQLWMNLGNVYLQSGRLGQAIASYERARKWIPSNRQLTINLEFAKQQVAGAKASDQGALTMNDAAGSAGTWLNRVWLQLRQWNAAIVDRIGAATIRTTVVIASLLFWAVLIVRAAGVPFPALRLSLLPLLLLVLATCSLGLSRSQPIVRQGVLVVNSVTLYEGDGQDNPQLGTLDSSDGQRVEILTSRKDWTQVRTVSGLIGWVPNANVETI